MIYIDFRIKETQERHFYKFEGDSFEITELHIAKTNMNGRVMDNAILTPFQ